MVPICLYMCVIEWSHEIADKQVAVTSLLKWARRPASGTVPIIPDRPQFLSVGSSRRQLKIQWQASPKASDPKEESDKGEGRFYFLKKEHQRIYAHSFKISHQSYISIPSNAALLFLLNLLWLNVL